MFIGDSNGLWKAGKGKEAERGRGAGCQTLQPNKLENAPTRLCHEHVEYRREYMGLKSECFLHSPG